MTDPSVGQTVALQHSNIPTFRHCEAGVYFRRCSGEEAIRGYPCDREHPAVKRSSIALPYMRRWRVVQSPSGMCPRECKHTAQPQDCPPASDGRVGSHLLQAAIQLVRHLVHAHVLHGLR